MNRTTAALILSTALLILGSGHSQAAEFNANAGVGVAHIKNHVKGEDNRNELFPFAELQYGMFILNQDGLGVTTSLTPDSNLSFFLTLRETSFDARDNKELAGLTQRDDTGELLISWVQMTPWAELSASVSTDLMDKHGGYELDLGISRQIPMLGGVVIPEAGIQYQSEKLVDYYYGVSQSEASQSIKAYDGKASLTSNLSLTHIHSLSSGWYTATVVELYGLGKGISDSSIVERDNYWMGSVALFYQF